MKRIFFVILSFLLSACSAELTPAISTPVASTPAAVEPVSQQQLLRVVYSRGADPWEKDPGSWQTEST
jgi:hypothetical protein